MGNKKYTDTEPKRAKRSWTVMSATVPDETPREGAMGVVLDLHIWRKVDANEALVWVQQQVCNNEATELLHW